MKRLILWLFVVPLGIAGMLAYWYVTIPVVLVLVLAVAVTEHSGLLDR